MNQWRARVRARKGYEPNLIRIEPTRMAMMNEDEFKEFIRRRPRGPGFDRERLAEAIELATGKKLQAITCLQFLEGLVDRQTKAINHHEKIKLHEDDHDQKTHRAMSVVLLYSVYEKLEFEMEDRQRDCFDWFTSLRHLLCHALEFQILRGDQSATSDRDQGTEDGVIPLAHSRGSGHQFL